MFGNGGTLKFGTTQTVSTGLGTSGSPVYHGGHSGGNGAGSNNHHGGSGGGGGAATGLLAAGAALEQSRLRALCVREGQRGRRWHQPHRG